MTLKCCCRHRSLLKLIIDSNTINLMSHEVMEQVETGIEPVEVLPVRVPPSLETVALVGLASTAVIAPIVAISQMSQASISSLPLPGAVKEFIKTFGSKMVEKTDKKKLKPGRSAHFISKTEAATLAFSILIMTVVVGFVKAGDMAFFLQPAGIELLLLTCVSVCIMKVTIVFSEALCALTYNLQKKLSLWWVGSATYLVTGMLFRFPFSSPTIIRYEEGISEKTKALLCSSKTLILLALAAPFGLMAASSEPFLVTFSDAGLLAVLTSVCYSFLPLPLLPGKAVYDYKKALSLVSVVPMLILLYCFTMQLLPYWAYVFVGVVSVILSGAGIMRLKHIPVSPKLQGNNNAG